MSAIEALRRALLDAEKRRDHLVEEEKESESPLWSPAEIRHANEWVVQCLDALESAQNAIARPVFDATQCMALVFDALVEAECAARDEPEILARIERARKALCSAGLGALHDDLTTGVQ